MKEITVLVCRPDGTQTVETRQVEDDWFSAPAETESAGGETA